MRRISATHREVSPLGTAAIAVSGPFRSIVERPPRWGRRGSLGEGGPENRAGRPIFRGAASPLRAAAGRGPSAATYNHHESGKCRSVLYSACGFACGVVNSVMRRSSRRPNSSRHSTSADDELPLSKIEVNTNHKGGPDPGPQLGRPGARRRNGRCVCMLFPPSRFGVARGRSPAALVPWLYCCVLGVLSGLKIPLSFFAPGVGRSTPRLPAIEPGAVPLATPASRIIRRRWSELLCPLPDRLARGLSAVRNGPRFVCVCVCVCRNHLF